MVNEVVKDSCWESFDVWDYKQNWSVGGIDVVLVKQVFDTKKCFFLENVTLHLLFLEDA